MKLLPILLLVIVSVSCSKKSEPADGGQNFYNIDYRIGSWSNPALNDTLEFVDASVLIRKQGGSADTLRYKIDGTNLKISLPDGRYETTHQIINAKGTALTLDNMYFTVGFNENSGSYLKIK